MNNLLVIGTGILPPARPGDVGYDLILSHDLICRAGRPAWGEVDARVKLPAGLWGLITARSSAAAKYGVQVLPGIIDNGYIGQLKIGVLLACRPSDDNDNDNDNGEIIIEKGARIAQLILMPMVVRELQHVEELQPTERGTDGFGSTD